MGKCTPGHSEGKLPLLNNNFQARLACRMYFKLLGQTTFPFWDGKLSSRFRSRRICMWPMPACNWDKSSLATDFELQVPVAKSKCRKKMAEARPVESESNPRVELLEAQSMQHTGNILPSEQCAHS